MKDLNGMESNRWKKRTRKNLTICMEMIANASSNVNSNVLVDGLKI